MVTFIYRVFQLRRRLGGIQGERERGSGRRAQSDSAASRVLAQSQVAIRVASHAAGNVGKVTSATTVGCHGFLPQEEEEIDTLTNKNIHTISFVQGVYEKFLFIFQKKYFVFR